MIEADRTINQNWYSIRYDSSAPAGLPPLIQAQCVVRYRDEAGTWLVALWDSARPDDAIAACILRVPADQVIAVTRHPDMGEAAAQIGPERTAHPG